MSDGLSWYITVLTVLNILAMAWLIWWSGKGSSEKVAKGDTMHHTWDGDLQEFNNPLPRWWLYLFYGTIAFGLIYLALYPGLGKMPGLLGWTQEGEWEREIEVAEAKYGPIFAAYADQDLQALMSNPEAMRTGQRLYLTYCSMCHGADAQGAAGFPNLTDNDWLYGGDPKVIKTTILGGRNGIMPAFGAALGDQGVEEVTEYLLKKNGREHDAEKAAAGEAKFAMCGGCHMPDGSGNQMLGAPNLVNNIWVWGGSRGAIRASIADGRNGVMPAYKDFLGEDRVHVLAAYIASLSAGK